MLSKETLLTDLEFCKQLMDRLISYAEANYTPRNNGSVVQNDIIRLRRELNNVRIKLEYDYKE